MKVLIVTYYWPPAGGSGVQRWLKFVKYMRDFGVEPVVYTVKDPNYALLDPSLEQEIPEGIEVLKQPIFEPNNILSKLKPSEKQTSAGFLNPNPGFFERRLQYIRANFFIPDARKFWVKPSVRFLSEYLKKNPVDVLITTGPPHSMHLIGLELKKRTGIKWLADFRDPWTDIDYFHQLPLTENARKKHFRLEKEVVENANAVVVVGSSMKKAYQKINPKTHVITNGFDDEQVGERTVLDQEFTITHIGMMNADRNPEVLWKALEILINEHAGLTKDLKVRLIGKTAPEVQKSIEAHRLESFVEYKAYLPHTEVLKYQRSAQVLLLAVNRVPFAKGIITGKIFEYLQAQRPVLAIAPVDGDLADIIVKTESGKVVDFDDITGLKHLITENYQKYQKGKLTIKSSNTERYHRRSLTRELVELLRKI